MEALVQEDCRERGQVTTKQKMLCPNVTSPFFLFYPLGTNKSLNNTEKRQYSKFERMIVSPFHMDKEK